MSLRRVLTAAALLLGVTTHAIAEGSFNEDPGRPHYDKSLSGKKIIMVPMATGFDLAQGWIHYIGKEVKAWGSTLDVRDPNWVVDAGAQAITDAIAAKPDVLIIMPPDVNSYVKLTKKAMAEGIYVVQIDNPSNVSTDLYAGADWVQLGQLEARAVLKGCSEGSSKKIALIQGDDVNATSLGMYAGITKELASHPDIQIVAKPVSNWDATTAKNVAATVIQQHPDLCGIIDYWDNTAQGTAAALRDAKLDGKVYLVSTGGGEQIACDLINKGIINAEISTEVPQQSRNITTAIKMLLQSGVPAGQMKTSLYTDLVTLTKDNAVAGRCWNLKELQKEQ
ncbi:sugar ABC transporter substrate-binding protein [Mesorhizobium argentiipisi]|uniref:Sugar ABC transporter substrate-binding protein n=1 Tax=Mesorhizobium argentiipisi TaxID=3015175 RepID=A0ABU8KBN8_9HYPH